MATSVVADLFVLIVGVAVVNEFLAARSRSQWQLVADYALVELSRSCRRVWVELTQGIGVGSREEITRDELRDLALSNEGDDRAAKLAEAAAADPAIAPPAVRAHLAARPAERERAHELGAGPARDAGGRGTQQICPAPCVTRRARPCAVGGGRGPAAHLRRHGERALDRLPHLGADPARLRARGRAARVGAGDQPRARAGPRGLTVAPVRSGSPPSPCPRRPARVPRGSRPLPSRRPAHHAAPRPYRALPRARSRAGA